MVEPPLDLDPDLIFIAIENGLVPIAKHSNPNGARNPGRIRTAAKGMKTIPMGTWRINKPAKSHFSLPDIFILGGS